MGVDLGVRRPSGAAGGFWIVAVAFAVLMAFGTAPTPLWPLYAARDGFGPTTLTAVFSGLVIGAALSLLGVGHLSDRLGRRRMAEWALGAAALAAVVFAGWEDVPGILAARVLNGVAIGLMAGTATSYLFDLYARAYPGRNARPAAMVATAANLGGLALGPFAAGLVATWTSDPLLYTQIGFAVALGVMLALVALVPETVDTGKAGRPPRFALRPAGRTVFGSAGLLGFVAFGLFGLFASLGSSVVRDLGVDAPLLSALPTIVMFAVAACAQIALDRAPWRRVLLGGAVAFPVGLALAALALVHPAYWLYVLGAAVAGGGAGLLFKTGLTRGAEVAQPYSRAGVLAVFYTIAYVGMAVPALLFSLALRAFSTPATMIGCAVALSLCALTAALGVYRKH
ncbi:MFS transporter [Actinomadura flavalba]|uniref:MFS transporter n=1 Tax=Actinomadura flavalba TaxID=1120938 RepID=UPI0003A7C4EC|nr:MFS transporter [Actinomadura flavalba]